MNVFTASGHIGRDAQTRYTSSDKAITNFSLAVASGWGDRKKTMWVRCNCWGERYAKLAQYLTKGSRVEVSGELSENEYESQGEKRKTIELTVRALDLTPRNEPSRHEQSKADGYQNQKPEFDDDIPF